MQTKIIFLTNIQFMLHHVNDMYVDEISSEFFVEMWDLSHIYGVYDESNFSGALKIESISQFSEGLLKFKNDFRVLVITNILNAKLKLIYTILKKYDIPIICISKDSFAASLEKRGKLRYLRYFRKEEQLRSILKATPILKHILEKRSVRGLPYDYLMGGSNYYPEQSRCFLRIHQIKYDEFLRAKTCDSIVKGKYLLYVGSAPTTHPMYCNKSNSLNHEDYMCAMRSYFEKVEKDIGLEIVISGHPKGRYLAKDWGGRKIYIGNTAELIHHCEGVICHFSTSLVNAVLEYKPIQILYNKEMLSSAYGPSMVSGLELGRICKTDVCDINDYHKWNLDVNKLAYDEFLENEIVYIQYKRKSNSELICGYLKEISKY